MFCTEALGIVSRGEAGWYVGKGPSRGTVLVAEMEREQEGWDTP